MDPYRVAWKNFRGFEGLTEIEFPALTLLIGRNNVGKSSAYAPLLLLRQTLDATDRKTALLGRGPLIDAGSYSDYVVGHDKARDVTFHLTIPADVRWSNPAKSSRPTRLELSFDSVDGAAARLIRHSVVGEDGKPIITRTISKDGEKFSVASDLLPTGPAGGLTPREVSELRRSMREEPPTNFQFDGIDGLIVPRRVRDNKDLWNKFRLYFNAATELVDVYGYTNDSIRGWLRRIAYIGPLRSLPRQTYRLAAEQPDEVGREGQHMPELLFRQRDGLLRDQTEKWLARLGYGPLDFDDLGGEYFQVFVKTPDGLKVNIAHSGVGLSQLLPLLVQGLSTSPRALLIAQQPEIHLNPAQQSILTDFLIELATSDRRVIVETHSEHVLLRLRRRMAEGTLRASDVAVYYFDSAEGRVNMDRVPVGDDGSIARSAWPKGFFEDQLEDSFALAVAQSLRGKK